MRLYRRANRDGNPRQLTSEAPAYPYGLAAPTIPLVEKPLRIGVLAVQGNFREHVAVLRRLGAE
ncbi:MAG: hypothetical protein ACRDNM_12380, partial [Gaiellaceae bacterium]